MFPWQSTAGEFVVILGHSGSGKTTLLSLIGGLTVPDSGEVLINGIENWQQSDEALSDMRNSTIGFIFQFASLIPDPDRPGECSAAPDLRQFAAG